MVVADGGIERGCQENNSNMQKGVTKGDNLPHDGHEEEYTNKISNCRNHSNRKKQQNKNTQIRQ